MPVDSTHPAYDNAIHAWTLVRDTAFGGGRVIKGKREQYLPRPGGMEVTEYESYLRRALFFNATKRAATAFRGFIFAENPEIEFGQYAEDPRIADFTKDATLTGKPWYDYSKELVGETLSLGRGGTLIEWASPAGEDRPYVVHYATEDILNWRYDVFNGRRVLALLTLREKVVRPDADEYEWKSVFRFRVCKLRFSADGPFVTYEVWQKDDKGEFARVSQDAPNRGGTPLQSIPFVFHNVTGDEADPTEIPLEDMANINVAHYRNSADLEQALHICGSPTLVLAGFPKTGEYVLGASKAIHTEKEGATAQFLQLDANAVSAITGGMDTKEKQMAALGAHMLERQSSGATQEAFETVQIRQSGQVSALMDIAIASSLTLSKVLRWVCWWDDRKVAAPEDLVDDVYEELNTDYTTLEMDAQSATALWQIYLGGGISYEEFFAKMQRGGWIRSETKIEDEKIALKNRPVALPDGTAPAPPGNTGAAGGGNAGKKQPPAKQNAGNAGQ